MKLKYNMNEIIKAFDLDAKVIKHTKIITKKVKFDTIKQTLPRKPDINFQMDYLELPKTKEGYNRLLTMIDLGTGEVDFEPTKGKTSAITLKAMKAIFKRKYLNQPLTIRTDAGTEFLGDVKKYMYNQSILHKPGISGRHKQTGSIERLNRDVATVLFAYMNTQEYKTGIVNSEWYEIIPKLREIMNSQVLERNKNRKLKGEANEEFMETPDDIVQLYSTGDLVYRKLDKPLTILGKSQNSDNFRAGDMRYDMKARAITKVAYYPNNIRYILNGLPNVSYTQDEIIPADEEEDDELFVIKKIIQHKMINKKMHYKVWWDGEKKADATWEPMNQLLDDGAKEHIDFYKNGLK